MQQVIKGHKMTIITFCNWYIKQPTKYRYIRIKNFLRYLKNRQEYITSSAIKTKTHGRIVLGKRHNIAIYKAHRQLIDYSWNITQSEQGFYTNKKRFVDRKEGAFIAINAGQKITEGLTAFLYSEDLW